MSYLTFDNLPETVAKIDRKIDQLISQQKQKEVERGKLLTLKELIDYLPEKPAKQTVYGWVNYKKIPFEKHGKKLYFRKSKIDRWLENARQVEV